MEASVYLGSKSTWSSDSSFSSKESKNKKAVDLSLGKHHGLKLTFALLSVSWLQRASCQSLWTPDRQLERALNEKFQFLHHPFKDFFPLFLVKSGLSDITLDQTRASGTMFHVYSFHHGFSFIHTMDSALLCEYYGESFWISSIYSFFRFTTILN